MKSTEGLYTLVLGRDAAGKTTLLEGIAETCGDLTLEATSTPEARAFKLANLYTPIDERFIADREALFLGLAGLTKLTLHGHGNRVTNVTTTSDPLVTRVSHAVMKSIVNGTPYEPLSVVHDWYDDLERYNLPAPDLIALVRVDNETADNRIRRRQASGLKDEAFWGFNAPFFLNRYQAGLHEVLDTLERFSWPTVVIDTGELDPAAALDEYLLARQSINRYEAVGY